MRRFLLCAATIWIAQCATQAELDRRTFIAKAIRKSPTHDDSDSAMPMARGLRPKTKKPTPAPTTTTPVPTTAEPTRYPTPQQPVIRRAPPARPNYPPPPQAYQQQGYAYQNYQQTPFPHHPPPSYYQQQYPPQGYQQQQQGYQYPSKYPYYAQQSRPQQQPQQQQQPPFYNPYNPYGYQSAQPMMVPVPVPVPMLPGLPGIPNLMQPFEAPTTAKPRKSHHKRRHYATLMPQVEEEETRRSSPTQEEIDAMDRNEVRRAPARKRQQHIYDDTDYSEEEASTAATMFPTMPTMLPPMKLPTLPPFTLPPSFEKLLGITTPKPKKEKRRKEKKRREYEEEYEFEPVKRRRNEEESRPHGRSLAVEEDRGRRDPFEGTEGGFEEQQKEEKESAPSVADRLMRKSLLSEKKGGEKEGEEDWLVPFRK